MQQRSRLLQNLLHPEIKAHPRCGKLLVVYNITFSLICRRNRKKVHFVKLNEHSKEAN